MMLDTIVLAVRRVEDFDLHKRLYQGKASLLYSATCKKSQIPVAVKVYRKARLSELNWYQVQNPESPLSAVATAVAVGCYYLVHIRCGLVWAGVWCAEHI